MKTDRNPGARGLIRTTLATTLLLCSWAMTGLSGAATASSAPAAAAFEPGTYKITNVASHSSVRDYNAGGDLFVSSTRENPGPFELWQVEQSGSEFTIQNVGINMINGLDSYATARQAAEGEPVVTNRDASTWSIAPAGEGTYVIKVPNQDLLWNAEPPVVPRGDVKLRAADGSDTQRWTLVRAS
ncbi:RICIN domain-containing protein [Nonomuraea sp. NBC_01738]|uniref:RICIN domain-containing protein n=1 Tax=Nonomuraea sp. NBC_01738 TaxID=2976003 RepID=UPI002E119B51|nr:RICIN domain-containing protein [Nonomuraea sp. NBC_01738]